VELPLGAEAHRPELPEREFPPVEPDPSLAEERESVDQSYRFVAFFLIVVTLPLLLLICLAIASRDGSPPRCQPCTFSFTGAIAGRPQSLRIIVTQDGTGGRSITSPPP